MQIPFGNFASKIERKPNVIKTQRKMQTKQQNIHFYVKINIIQNSRIDLSSHTNYYYY